MKTASVSACQAADTRQMCIRDSTQAAGVLLPPVLKYGLIDVGTAKEIGYAHRRAKIRHCVKLVNLKSIDFKLTSFIFAPSNYCCYICLDIKNCVPRFSEQTQNSLCT